MYVKFILVSFVLFTSLYLFYKASGTLNIQKINIVSYLFYMFIIHNFLGGSLIYLGYTDHYLIKKINNITTIERTYYIICFVAIVLPLTMCLLSKVLKINTRTRYDEYLKKEILIEHETYVFAIMAMISTICVLLTTYMFIRIGRVPLFDLIFNRNMASMAQDRINISTGVYINPYVRNIIIMEFTPILSYLSYIYYKSTLSKRWGVLFVILLMTSILIKTYNYAKSPVISYIFVFLLINIVIKSKIKGKTIIIFTLGSIIVFSIMYLRMGYNVVNEIDIYNGPLGRIIFTQIATLFLHIDMFPAYVGFLNGRSFSPSMLKIFSNGFKHMRSGRAVMKFYSPEKVVAGTAGVMNTLFVGEAYANFGIVGVLFATLYVGALMQGVFLFFISKNKTPINIAIYIFLMSKFVAISQGGFVDYIYSFNIIIGIIFLISIHKISEFLSNKTSFQSLIMKIDDLTK